MGSEISFVIKDQGGNFVPGKRTFSFINNEWLYYVFTGMASGFISYVSSESAEKVKMHLQKLSNENGLDKNFHVEKVFLKKIKRGMLVVENINSKIHIQKNKEIVNI